MTGSAASRWRTTRYLLGQFLPFTLLVWLGTLAVAAGLTIVVTFFGEMSPSAWDIAMQVARWFAAGVGAYVTYTLLPSHVAYGQTRRDFLRQCVPFALVAVTVLAALAALGYVLEGALYRVLGATPAIDAGRSFGSPDQVGIAVVAFWAQFAAWMVAGALVGAAAYRDDGSLLAAIPAALLAVAAAALAVDRDGLPFLDRFLRGVTIPDGVAAALWLAFCLLAAALTWLIARDLSLRNRPS